MKKSMIIVLVMLFIIPTILSLEFEMKDNFMQGETLIAKISGNFLDPIGVDNIFFYEEHVRIPMVYDVVRIDDEFYVYALLPEVESNYSIKLEDVRYMKGSQVSIDDVIKNFSVGSEIFDFSVNPGVVKTDESFFIKIQNLKEFEINVNVTLDEDYNQTIALKSGEIEEVEFSFENGVESSFRTVKFESEGMNFDMIVYWVSPEYIAIKNKTGVKFDPSELDAKFVSGENGSRIVYFFNYGTDSIMNVSINVSSELKDYVNLSVDYIDEVKANSSVKIELMIFSEEEGVVVGDIIAKGENNIKTKLDVIFEFVSDFIPLEEEEEKNETKANITSSETCPQMGGIICSEDKKCDEEPLYARDGVCCLGSCTVIEESATGKIVGWVIIVLIVGFLLWFLVVKYRRTRRKVDLFSVAKGKK